MVTVRTSRALVEALGDEAQRVQHLDVESDLNELLALTELVNEKLADWSGHSAARRVALMAEAAQIVARGDRLSDESILRPSAVAPEEIELARARWAAVRRVLTSLTLS